MIDRRGLVSERAGGSDHNEDRTGDQVAGLAHTLNTGI